MTTELWGLKNCDTCKKALKWLTSEGIEHSFHDLRKEPPSTERLGSWLSAVGADNLINRRGTTWRKLSEAEQASADEDSGALSLISAHDALMKRPIWEVNGQVLVGFAKAEQEQLTALLKG